MNLRTFGFIGIIIVVAIIALSSIVWFYNWKINRREAPIKNNEHMGNDMTITQQSSRERTIRFTGNISFRTIDVNRDKLAEQLAADVEVETVAVGEYFISGILNKGERLIANRPIFETALASDASLHEPAGTYVVTIVFSGEQIRRSRENGPYTLKLMAMGTGPQDHVTLTVTTPAFAYLQFGESVSR